MISREKLRGKPLDSDCMRANKTTHEYGMEDDRVYCYDLYEDMSDWKIRKKCRECGAYVENATPLKGRRVGMMIDYTLAKECKNEEVWYICYKCGKCGRVFENGFMVDDGGTTIREEQE